MGALLTVMKPLTDAASGIDVSGISTALSSGLSDAATQTVSIMAVVAPYGLTIFVAVLVVNYAKKFFKKISG